MKLGLTLPALALVILLSGCLAKMEKVTEDTKAAVEKSVEVIESTHHDTKLGGAVNMLPKDIAALTRAAEVVIFLTAEDSVHKQIGASMPLNYYNAFDDAGPNVSIVGIMGDSTKNIVPISPEKYKIFELAIMRLLRDLTSKTQTPITDSEFGDVKEKASRLFLVATAVLGAQLGPMLTDEDEKVTRAALANQKVNQEEASKHLLSLAALFDDDTSFKVKTLIDCRFHNVLGGHTGQTL